MFKKKSILAIIPARLGSKGIKNKNLKKIGSLSLIEIAIKNAEKSKYLDKIVVTSDDPKILKLKIKYKKVIFIKRKKSLSSDKSKMIDVVLDVNRRIKYTFNFILILQVTCPFRTSKDIDYSIKKFTNSNADTLISVTRMEDFHPARMYKIKNKFLLPINRSESSTNRQLLSSVYHRNGLIYLFKSRNLRLNSFYGKKIISYNICKSRSLNIDDPIDLIYARALQKKTTIS